MQPPNENASQSSRFMSSESWLNDQAEGSSGNVGGPNNATQCKQIYRNTSMTPQDIEFLANKFDIDKQLFTDVVNKKYEDVEYTYKQVTKKKSLGPKDVDIISNKFQVDKNVIADLICNHDVDYTVELKTTQKVHQPQSKTFYVFDRKSDDTGNSIDLVKEEENIEEKRPEGYIPSTAKLSAQIMDVPYHDFETAYAKSNVDLAPIAKPQTFDIIQRIKDVYKACTCKVCECIASIALSSTICKCKPCACIECANLISNLNESKRHSSLAVTVKNGCDCKKCKSAPCKGVVSLNKCIGGERGVCKGKGTSIIPITAYRSRGAEMCSCEPCQCDDCKRVSARLGTLVVAPVGENPHMSCDCSPCLCAECSHAIRILGPRMRDMGTTIERHQHCQCNVCTDDACLPDSGDTCWCVRRDQVMRKPVESNTHDYDIRLAQTSINGPSTFAMYTAVTNTYPKKKECNCAPCECMVCASQKSSLPISRIMYPLKPPNKCKETNSNPCGCSPCKCSYCVTEDVPKEEACQCLKCECITCSYEPPTRDVTSASGCIKRVDKDIDVTNRFERITTSNIGNQSGIPVFHNKYVSNRNFSVGESSNLSSVDFDYHKSYQNVDTECIQIFQPTKTPIRFLTNQSKHIDLINSLPEKSSTEYYNTEKTLPSLNNVYNWVASPYVECAHPNPVHQPVINSLTLADSNVTICNDLENNNYAPLRSNIILPTKLPKASKNTIIKVNFDSLQKDIKCKDEEPENKQDFQLNSDLDQVSESVQCHPLTSVNNFKMTQTDHNGEVNCATRDKCGGSDTLHISNRSLRNNSLTDNVYCDKRWSGIPVDYKFFQKTIRKARMFSRQLVKLLDTYETASKQIYGTDLLSSSTFSVKEDENNDVDDTSDTNAFREVLDGTVDDETNCDMTSIISFDERILPQEQTSTRMIEQVNHNEAQVCTTPRIEHVETPAIKNIYRRSSLYDNFGDSSKMSVRECLNTITEELPNQSTVNSCNLGVKVKILDKPKQKYYIHQIYHRTINVTKKEMNASKEINTEEVDTSTKTLDVTSVPKMSPKREVINLINDVTRFKDIGIESDSLLEANNDEVTVKGTRDISNPMRNVNSIITIKPPPSLEPTEKRHELNYHEVLPNILKKNLEFPDGYEVSKNNVIPPLTTLEKDVKDTVSAIDTNMLRSIFIANTVRNQVIQENEALINLISQVEQIIQSLTVKPCQQVDKKNCPVSAKDKLEKSECFGLAREGSSLVSCQNKKENIEVTQHNSVFDQDDLKVNSLFVRRMSDHTVMVKWQFPKNIKDVDGYELLIDGRTVQKFLSPTKSMAIVTCLPRCEVVLLTVRTVTRRVRRGVMSPACTVLYRPKKMKSSNFS